MSSLKKVADHTLWHGRQQDVAIVEFKAAGLILSAFDITSKASFLYVWSDQEAFSKFSLEKTLRMIESLGVSNVKQLSFQFSCVGDFKVDVSKIVSDLSLDKVVLKPRQPICSAYFYASSGKLRIPTNLVESPKSPKKDDRIRVAIVDDSKTIRDLLTRILKTEEGFDVVATFESPSEALRKIPSLSVDVVTLDIHMPEMNGVQLLEKLLAHKFIPAVMITSLSMEDGPEVLNALELGAVDYLQKPSLEDIHQASILIKEKIKAAANAKEIKHSNSQSPVTNLKFPDGVVNSHLIAIGSSTGGTEALRALLEQFGENIPPVVIVQHIPPVFSLAFANRLNQLCPFEVKEAAHGDLLIPGRVLVAPGGFQMEVRKHGSDLKIQIADSAPVNRHKPSVDVLFESLLKQHDRKVVGVILTGMGTDGAQGLLALRKAGARTIAQDEASSVVYGMPREAARIDAVEMIRSLKDIPRAIIEATQRRRAA